MKIFIKLPSGETISLEVENTISASDVKRKILEYNFLFDEQGEQTTSLKKGGRGGGKEESHNNNQRNQSPDQEEKTLNFGESSKKRKFSAEFSEYYLQFEGRQLFENNTLQDFGINSNSTLILLPQQLSYKNPRLKCAFGDCLKKPILIIGNCKFCSNKYCAQHRLPESHSCSNMTDCRQQSFDRNKAKLLKEKCVAAKV